MKTVNYKIGMLVDHPNRPQWGPGKVVHVEGSKVHVFFRDNLERKAKPILCSIVPLTVAASQTDAVLDELPVPSQEDGAWLLPARYGPQTPGTAAPKKKSSRAKVAAAAPAAAPDPVAAAEPE